MAPSCSDRLRQHLLSRVSRYFGDRPLRLLVACSAGRDSTVLLHALAELRSHRRIALRTAHFDHGLRTAEERKRDRRQLECLCASLAVPLIVEARRNSSKEEKTIWPEGFPCDGPEAGLRRARYRFLAETARLGYDAVVLGHHAQDQLETVLMRAFWTASAEGLAGMQELGGDELVLFRPLLELPEALIAGYAQENDLHWVEDRTNIDERYLRNHIRRRIVPVLRSEIPEIEGRVVELTARLRETFAGLTAEAEERIRWHARGGSLVASRNSYERCAPALRRQALMLAANRFKIARVPWRLLDPVVLNPRTGQTVRGAGLEVSVSRSMVRLAPEREGAAGREYVLPVREEVPCLTPDGLRFVVRAAPGRDEAVSKVAPDSDSNQSVVQVFGPLIVRSARAGDGAARKGLSELIRDRGVSLAGTAQRAQRNAPSGERMSLLQDRAGIVAAFAATESGWRRWTRKAETLPASESRRLKNVRRVAVCLLES